MNGSVRRDRESVWFNVGVRACKSLCCVHVCECVCLCVPASVGLCAAVPGAVLIAVDCAHLHSESRRFLPLLVRRGAAAVPVVFGHSCAGEHVADFQAATMSPGLGPEVGLSYVNVGYLVGSGNTGSSLLFLPAFFSLTRWRWVNSGTAGVLLLNCREFPARFLDTLIALLTYCTVRALWLEGGLQS